jgi:hypothetical protein
MIVTVIRYKVLRWWNKALEHSCCEPDSSHIQAHAFSNFRFAATDDVRRLRIVRNGSMEIVAHEQSIPTQSGTRYVIFLRKCVARVASSARTRFVKSLERAIQLSGKLGTILYRSMRRHQLVSSRVVNQLRRFYFIWVVCPEKGGNPIGSSPPEGFGGCERLGGAFR